MTYDAVFVDIISDAIPEVRRTSVNRMEIYLKFSKRACVKLHHLLGACYHYERRVLGRLEWQGWIAVAVMRKIFALHCDSV